MKRAIPGVNIQWPWSQLLLSGVKTVETRGYPLPAKYIGQELALIETPGPRGKKEAGIERARIIGTIVFSGSIEYRSGGAWSKDRDRHQVQQDDPVFAFRAGTPKWGWVVEQVTKLIEPSAAPARRGIVFAARCAIPSGYGPSIDDAGFLD